MLRRYAAGSITGSGAFGIGIFGRWLGAEVVGENGVGFEVVCCDGHLPSVGDWIEEFEEASEAVDSVMDGLDPLLELLLKMPILSGEG